MPRWGICVALLLVAGCGGVSKKVLSQVSGTVLLDGKPLAGAMVTLHNVSGGRGAYGTTDANGNFTVETSRTEKGADPGNYHVTVDKPAGGSQPAPTFDQMQKDLDAGKQPEPAQVASAIPVRYQDPNGGSGLTAKVEANVANKLKFELKSQD